MTDSGVPVFDIEQLVVACGDDIDFQREIIADFLSQFESRLEDIRAAVEARDPAATHRTAHALKGSAASLGAAALAESTRRLEALGRTSEMDGAPAALQEVLAEAERLREAIARFLSDRAA